ncbi:hypothetical protein [Pedobacter panaciterrae]
MFNFIGYYINSIYSGKLINYPIGEQIIDIIPMIATSVFAGILCYLADTLCFSTLQLLDVTRIIIDGLFFSLIYLASSSILRLAPIHDFKQLILKR